MKSKLTNMYDSLEHAVDSNGHPIAQPTWDKVIGLLREMKGCQSVYTYEWIAQIDEILNDETV